MAVTLHKPAAPTAATPTTTPAKITTIAGFPIAKTPRRFTVAYTDRGAGYEIRRIIDGTVRAGDDSNHPWRELRNSGLDWFPVTAVSAADALRKGRTHLGNELAALWDHMGVEMDDSPETDAYFRTVLVTANLS